MLDRKPMVLIFAGPNGSGKSTITQYFGTVGSYTNADDVVRTTGMSNEEAAKFVDQLRYASINRKEDFTFETVISSEYKMDLVRCAKREGYFIKCVFVLTIDPLINVSRVETRVEQGGHFVSRDKVVSRYYKSLSNVGELLSLCDIMHIYDNTKTPVRIIRKHKEFLSMYPNELWSPNSIWRLANGYDLDTF